MGQGLRGTWAVRVTHVPVSHERSQVFSSLGMERLGMDLGKESHQKPWFGCCDQSWANGFSQGWEWRGAGVQVMAWAWEEWPSGGLSHCPARLESYLFLGSHSVPASQAQNYGTGVASSSRPERKGGF